MVDVVNINVATHKQKYYLLFYQEGQERHHREQPETM
jgi:hypothetical protein